MSEYGSSRGFQSDRLVTRHLTDEQQTPDGSGVYATSTAYDQHVAQARPHARPPAVPHAAEPDLSTSRHEPRDAGYSQGGAQTALSGAQSRSSDTYRGVAGDTLRITLKSSVTSVFCAYLRFGTFTRVSATVDRQTSSSSDESYLLSALVPSIATGSQPLPLMIEFEDENTALLEQKFAGYFYYGFSQYDQYLPESRKRKSVHDPPSVSAPVHLAKRRATQPLRPLQGTNSSPVRAAHPMHLPMGSPYGNPIYAVPQTDHSIASQLSYVEPLSARSAGYDVSGSPIATSHTARYKEHAPEASLGHYVPNSTLLSPRIRTRAVTMSPTAKPISASQAPGWVRTSELRQQLSSPRVTAAGMTTTFNPFAQFADTKAKLDLVGDLDTMCNDWSVQERIAKRRLVEFERSQSGSTITANFRPVTVEERSDRNPCVSCIWWARRGAHYVTSVDTIALLQGLVAVTFTVEEKNRIRRNLEGYKPFTVSKNKDDSDDMFRLIMGFGVPKPRNIEKDIKVFPWPILKIALSKIIGKYSANYASTSTTVGQASNSSPLAPRYIDITDTRRKPSLTTRPAGTSPELAKQHAASASSALGVAGTNTGPSSSSREVRASMSLPQLQAHSGDQYSPVGTAPAAYSTATYGAGYSQSAPSPWTTRPPYNRYALQSPADITPHTHARARSRTYQQPGQRGISASPLKSPVYMPRYDGSPPGQ